jgi:tRNA nucleotidyltransferase (CCA-adding enzyme)
MPIDAPPDALRRAILAALSAAAREAVERFAAHCAARAIPAYAVGGTIRDALMDRPIIDVDLAVEGDAIHAMREAFPAARITTHSRFRTATLRVEGTRIDVVTGRSETYARAGALPKVTPGTIVDDMRRRDFSVNAIALRLEGDPALIDPCGGIDDLRGRRIRVLHDASFRDDATRIFRAFRYAARLGLEIDRHTRELIADGVRYIATIGGERLRREIELLLRDEPPGEAMAACAAADAVAAIDTALHWNAATTVAYKHHALRALLRDAEIAPYGFALLSRNASASDAQGIIERLRLKRAEAAAVAGVAALRQHVETLQRPQAKPSGVALLLDRYPAAAVAAFAADNASAIAGDVALRYLREWRHVQPRLNGRDLQAMGVPEGPQIARCLQLLRAAKLDGLANSVDDECALVSRFAGGLREADATNAPIELQPDDE